MAARGTTSTRKPATAKVTALGDPGATLNGVVVGGPDVIRMTSRKTKGPVERAVLFSIDGTDYTIPAHPQPNLALKVLDVVRRQGENVGTAFMLTTLVGEDGYRALMDFDDLEADDLKAVLKAATKTVFGALEDPT